MKLVILSVEEIPRHIATRQTSGQHGVWLLHLLESVTTCNDQNGSPFNTFAIWDDQLLVVGVEVWILQPIFIHLIFHQSCTKWNFSHLALFKASWGAFQSFHISTHHPPSSPDLQGWRDSALADEDPAALRQQRPPPPWRLAKAKIGVVLRIEESQSKKGKLREKHVNT